MKLTNNNNKSQTMENPISTNPILVFYLSYDDMPFHDEDKRQYLTEIQKNLSDEQRYTAIIFPTKGQKSHVECLNPQLLTEEEFQKTKNMVIEISNQYNDFINQIKS